MESQLLNSSTTRIKGRQRPDNVTFIHMHSSLLDSKDWLQLKPLAAKVDLDIQDSTLSSLDGFNSCFQDSF